MSCDRACVVTQMPARKVGCKLLSQNVGLRMPDLDQDRNLVLSTGRVNTQSLADHSAKDATQQGEVDARPRSVLKSGH